MADPTGLSSASTDGQPRVTTGIPELDRWLDGGLIQGRYFLVSGAPGAGKTSVSLHFVGAGLARGERCAIVTQERPDDVAAQAAFLGFDFDEPARRGQLTVLRYLPEFGTNYSRYGH